MRTPEQILQETKTIALVGASPNPDRPSHGVMRYLLAQGYRVIPVRPDGAEILGLPSVSSLAEIEEPIDLVDVFRREEAAPDHAREAVEAGRRVAGATRSRLLLLGEPRDPSRSAEATQIAA